MRARCRGILKGAKCRAITRKSIENNEMSEKHEDQFPLARIFITPPASYGGGEGAGGTIAALSWSQIKNNYFLRLILNQGRGRYTQGLFFLREKSGHYPSNKILVNEILALLQM